MLYWERRRSRIVQPRSLSSISVPRIVQTPQVPSVEQLPFPQSLGCPASSSFPRSGEANTPVFVPHPSLSLASRCGGSSTLQRQTAGLIETPVPPPSQLDVFGSVNAYLLPDRKAGQAFCLIPQSPTTSFYQSVISPRQREKVKMVCVYPPQSGKQRVMVFLSIVCLCLFVILSVLMLLSPNEQW